jgi:hypothetical protein
MYFMKNMYNYHEHLKDCWHKDHTVHFEWTWPLHNDLEKALSESHLSIILFGDMTSHNIIFINNVYVLSDLDNLRMTLSEICLKIN